MKFRKPIIVGMFLGIVIDCKNPENKGVIPIKSLGKINSEKDLEGQKAGFAMVFVKGRTFLNRVESLRVIDRNGRDSSMRFKTLGFRLAI